MEWFFKIFRNFLEIKCCKHLIVQDKHIILKYKYKRIPFIKISTSLKRDSNFNISPIKSKLKSVMWDVFADQFKNISKDEIDKAITDAKKAHLISERKKKIKKVL